MAELLAAQAEVDAANAAAVRAMQERYDAVISRLKASVRAARGAAAKAQRAVREVAGRVAEREAADSSARHIAGLSQQLRRAVACNTQQADRICELEQQVAAAQHQAAVAGAGRDAAVAEAGRVKAAMDGLRRRAIDAEERVRGMKRKARGKGKKKAGGGVRQRPPSRCSSTGHVKAAWH